MVQTVQDLRQIAAGCETWNTRLVGQHDLNGYGDGMQVVVNGQFAYVAHVGTSTMALSILDVSDPENPKLVRQIPRSKNAHSHKVQIVGNVMIQNSEYISYLKKADDDPSITGVIVYNLDDPTDPKQVAFYPTIGGKGVHRIWFREAPYAHLSAQINGSRTQGYQILDLSDPSHPALAGQWWPPGTFETDADPWVALDAEQHHLSVHGVIPHGNRGYCSCIDAGLVILDIGDMQNIKVLGRTNWCPPFGGYSHTSLPLPGRGLLVEVCEAHAGPKERERDRRIWMIDIREERQPVIIGSFPRPKPPKKWGAESFFDLPGPRFGPHNVHENYPGSFNSETLIFSTWFAGGMRITDISDPSRPEEIGYFMPPAPPDQPACQLNDLYVAANKLCYITDRINGGLYIAEYTG